MKYYIRVQADKSFYVTAISKSEARKKVINKFKTAPGKLDIDIDEHDDEWKGYEIV